MSLPLYLIDAFTDVPFRGNPAAVCLLESAADETWMQSVAAEMNQAETAFVRPLEKDFELRWFTPTVEVDLCGHATLAAACALWTHGAVAADQAIRFRTRSGVLTAEPIGGKIRLDFPSEAPSEVGSAEAVRQLFPDATFIGANRMDWFVALPTEADVTCYQPDFAAIAALGKRGLIITAAATRRDCDFVSRFFGPQSGVDEDSVTGSAHCALAPFWAARLGRNEQVGYQASKRGGFVGVELRGNRVGLLGNAALVVRGQLQR